MPSTRRFITHVPGLADPITPISHAVVVGAHCHVSGQLSVDANGDYVPGSAAEEADRAFANVFAVIRAAEFAPTDIVFVDIAFTDLADAPAVNAVYARLFEEGRRPARTIYQAAALPYGGRVKVQAAAIRDAES
jgi:2-iminobutanoate/2-iminopropanoate deaminase